MSQVTTIEHLPTELWFQVFSFFDLLSLHRSFYSLNSRINGILRETQDLQLKFDYYYANTSKRYFLEHITDSVQAFGPNIRSLCYPDERFLSLYPLHVHFCELRMLKLDESSGSITCDSLRQLKFLETMEVKYEENFREILVYLNTGGDGSLKRLFLHGNMRATDFPVPLQRSRPIALSYLYVNSISIQTLFTTLWLLPEILTLHIGLLTDSEYQRYNLPPGDACRIQSLRIDLMSPKYISTNSFWSLLRKIILPSLRKLNLRGGMNAYLLGHGHRWETLLQPSNVETFSLEFSVKYREKSKEERRQKQQVLLQSFQSDFWQHEKKTIINETTDRTTVIDRTAERNIEEFHVVKVSITF